MKIFHKKDDTVGVTLWRWGNFAIELWYLRCYGFVTEHYHENIDSTLVHIYGKGILYIEKDKFVNPKRWSGLKTFSVLAGVKHSLFASWQTGILFFNIEKLKNGSKLSAAQDYHAV